MLAPLSDMPMPPTVGAAHMTGLMWMPTRPLTAGRLFAVHPQPVPVLPILGLLLLGAYVAGVVMLARRGDAWPPLRIVCWLLGVASIELMTATGFDGYGMELFSVHMIQHMTLSMLTPILLCLGAPVTLLLRALSGGGTGRRRMRAGLLRVLHSRLAAVVANPIVTGILFLFSLYALYFTRLFDVLMSTMWGHNVMLIHFLLIGSLYFWGILGVDPSPRRGTRLMRQAGGPVARIAEMAVPVPFHAFFGVVLMMASTVMVSYYAAPMRSLDATALSDQQTAGGIAWGFTELPTLLVLLVLFLQWQRSDARRTVAAERRAARYGDVELDEYNARLQALARRDAAQ
ncbi:cytochrome c oxidase assembly protein [Microbacterium rhizosphaerae]|uniref:Cytochrome c oxidase assembly protein n=1 Tax=Microbacterium rhizosphaerae TaxID=1678237 RepID=A0ABZ0SQQ0_9MICO|nr:cytochrome c oxidase assembly protein [Microbacterium rhizosphaerae]WPR91508.1 cytochrome c oxidase assembly protein [Microbacterium rhizosphaerae]